MFQQRADLAFAGHALRQSRAPQQARQLQCHLALEGTVGALGQPHRAHATLADLAQQAVRTDALAGRDGRGVRIGQVRQAWHLADQPGALRAPMHFQHLAQQWRQAAVGLGQVVQPGLAFRGPEVQRLVEQAAQRTELGGRESGHRSRQDFSIAISSSRALSQSRRTVRSVRPSTSAISCSE